MFDKFLFTLHVSCLENNCQMGITRVKAKVNTYESSRRGLKD